MATTLSHRIPTLQHAIADLTGYEDADTLRWQQACVQAAQHLTAERGRYAGTDTDQLAHGLDLAQRGGVTLAEDLDDLRAEVTSGTAHDTVDLAQLGCPCLDFQQRQAPCTHLLGRSWREAHHHHRFAKLLHALDHVRGAWRLPIPARDEDVACLGHLVVPAHAGGLAEALPFRAEELLLDRVLPRPTVAELIRAPGAARDDLRNAVAIRR